MKITGFTHTFIFVIVACVLFFCFVCVLFSIFRFPCVCFFFVSHSFALNGSTIRQKGTFKNICVEKLSWLFSVILCYFLFLHLLESLCYSFVCQCVCYFVSTSVLIFFVDFACLLFFAQSIFCVASF